MYNQITRPACDTKKNLFEPLSNSRGNIFLKKIIKEKTSLRLFFPIWDNILEMCLFTVLP